MPDPTVAQLAEGMREDLRGIARALRAVDEDLLMAHALLLVEFNQGGVSGLRAEAIAAIQRARLRLDGVLT